LELFRLDRETCNRCGLGVEICAGDWMRWVLENMEEVARAIRFDKDLALWEGGTDIILQNAPVAVITDAKDDDHTVRETRTIALTSMELAATSPKLGCCRTGHLEKAASYFPPMKKELSLPEGHLCFGAMIVGHPRYEHHRLATRETPKITWQL
jgi:nitroreductase